MADSNLEACIARVAARGSMGKTEALDILQQVADRAEDMRASGVADPAVAAAKELAARLKETAAADRVDAVRNAAIRTKVMADVKTAGGIGNAALTLRSLLHGTNAGARDSVQARWWGVGSGWQAAVDNRLRQGGVAKAAVSGAIDRDVAREMWSMNAGEAGRATQNNPARAIAEAYFPALNLARDRLNGAGARIGDAADYVAHTSHDPIKMRAAAGPRQTPDAAFASWWGATEPRLAEKTFDGLTPKAGETEAAARQRFGRSVFDALVSGIHMTQDGAFGIKTGDDGFVPPAFEGTRNLAKKLSQERVLFWKDADSWYDHMRQFGRPRSLFEGVMGTLDTGARQLALMEKLGTNPTANLNLIIRRIQEAYRPDLDGVKAFQGKVAGLENVMAQLDGSANIPANEMAAKIGASIRTYETVSSLGGVGITHFASIWPTVTSEMAQHGVSRLGALGNMVGALVKGRGSVERQEVLAQLGAFAHGLTRDMRARWQPDEPIPGKLSALANTFMKATGIHYVFDNTQAAVREMLANQLARATSKPFAELEPHLAQMLDKYGIGAREWDLLRAVPDLPAAEGHAYMTPNTAARIDDAAAEAHLKATRLVGADAEPDVIARATDRLKNDLSDKLLSYYSDAAAHGVVTAGVRERAMVLGGSRPGSVAGELTRFMTQFKMWPLAAMYQVLGRDIHLSLSNREMAWNIGTLLALTTASGYVRMAVNDTLTGRPLRDPLDMTRDRGADGRPKGLPHGVQVLAAALAQGGGIGILGDFLFGEANRFGGGLIGTLGGPVVGDADQLIKLYQGWTQGKSGWGDLAHFMVRHVPFANLAYLKGALDYLLWYHLYEAASPGWWERTNRRLIKEQGRAMVGYKPGGSIPWTPWAAGSQATQ